MISFTYGRHEDDQECVFFCFFLFLFGSLIEDRLLITVTLHISVLQLSTNPTGMLDLTCQYSLQLRFGTFNTHTVLF